MKAFKLIGMTLLLTLGAINLTSCSDDDPVEQEKPTPQPEITVPSGEEDFFQKGMNFDTSSSEKSFTFTTTADWNISLTEARNGTSWCTVTPSSGKAGKNTVKVKTSENTTFDNRGVVLTLTAGTVKKTVAVSQKQKDALTLTSNKFEVDAKGGDINVEVKANVNYEVAISDNAKSWISKKSKSRGLTTSKVTFSVAETEEATKREGTITIKSGKFAEEIHVYQAGQKILLLSKNEVEVPAEGDTIQVEIKSNFQFDVKMPAAKWISELKSRSASSHTLYYVVKANETSDPRTAEIVFFDKDSDLSNTLKITQGQQSAFSLSETSFNVAATGGNIEVGISTNIAYELSINCDWIKQTTTKALNKESLTFEVQANETDQERSGKITFTDNQKAVLGTIIVSQSVKQKGAKKLVGFKLIEKDLLTNKIDDENTFTPTYNAAGQMISYRYTTKDEIDTCDVTMNLKWFNDRIECTPKDNPNRYAIYHLKNGRIQNVETNLQEALSYDYEIFNTTFTYNADGTLKTSNEVDNPDNGLTEWLWKDNLLVEISSKEEGFKSNITYSDVSFKGVLPFFPSAYASWDYFYYAYPDLIGLQLNKLPIRYEETFDTWNEKSVSDLTYTLDKDGYVVGIKEHYQDFGEDGGILDDWETTITITWE